MLISLGRGAVFNDFLLGVKSEPQVPKFGLISRLALPPRISGQLTLDLTLNPLGIGEGIWATRHSSRGSGNLTDCERWPGQIQSPSMDRADPGLAFFPDIVFLLASSSILSGASG